MTVGGGITYIPQADGSIQIFGHRRTIRVRKSAAPWRGDPQPSECWQCHAKAMYVTAQTHGGPELMWITYECGECGMKEREPFD